jgi:hypothetical protein
VHGYERRVIRGIGDKMKRRVILVLLLFFWTIALNLQPSNAQRKNVNGPRFKISGTGLEVSDYKKLVVLTELDEHYDEKIDTGKIGLTEAMIRTECESRLKEAGLNPTSKFSRPEYLSVNVKIRHRSYYILVQFNRPVQYQVEETQFMKYGANIWQKGLLGQHGYAPEYILERLDSVLDDFVGEYLKTNSIKTNSK